MSGSWPFEEQRDLGVFCSRAIFEATKPILLVAHDADGSWQFLDGQAVAEGDTPVHVCLEEVVSIDPSIGEIATLPRGWSAERRMKGALWVKSRMKNDS